VEKIEKLIGRRIKDARLKAKMSQSRLAKDAKSSLTTINRIEKGRQAPHSSTLSEIARVLNIDR
jgi:transcriptional regulator with XRE-family HTH domain